jgi:hypothetical protein
MLYVKIYDAGTRAVNTSTSIKVRGCVSHHPHMMGQDGAWQGTLSPYLNDCRAQVRVVSKAAHPYRPPQRPSNKAKSGPQGSDLRNLLDHHPPHHQEDSKTGPNTMEASNRPRQTNYLTHGPTVHVHPFMDIEIISL